MKPEILLNYELESIPPLLIIHFKGKLMSAWDASQLMKELENKHAEAEWFLLDMHELQYISSEGLSIMLKLLTRSRTLGGETYITGINEHLQTLLLTSKLSNIFTPVSSVEEVLQRIKEMQKA